MSKIEFSITYLPAKEIIAVCGECHQEILRLKYDDYDDRNSKFEQLKAGCIQCQKCDIELVENE